MPLQIIRNDITKMNTDALSTPPIPRCWAVAAWTAASTGLPALRFWPSVRSWAAVRPGTLKSHTPGTCPAICDPRRGDPYGGAATTGRRKSLTSCYHTSLFLAKSIHAGPLLFP